MSEHAHPTMKDYTWVFVGLIILTSTTVGIAYSGLSVGMKEFLAFAIATVKALMVATIFMHLKYETRIIVIFAVTPVILALLFILAISPDVGVVG